MKKILTLGLATIMIIICCGCDSTEEVSIDISSTTANDAIEPMKTAEIEATVPDEAEIDYTADATASEPTATSSLQEIFDARGEDEYWIINLYNKADQWDDGNVVITLSADIGEISGSTIIHFRGEKYCHHNDMSIMNSMTIYDGIGTYKVDLNSSTYERVQDNPDAISSIKKEYLLGPEAKESFLSAGVEDLNGTPYIFEEYLVEGFHEKFYFDQHGNPQYTLQTQDDESLLFTFTVEFLETANESVFRIPEGCTEVSP